MGAGLTGASPAGCWHLSLGKGWKNQHVSLSGSEPVPCLNSTPQHEQTLSLLPNFYRCFHELWRLVSIYSSSEEADDNEEASIYILF